MKTRHILLAFLIMILVVLIPAGVYADISLYDALDSYDSFLQMDEHEDEWYYSVDQFALYDLDYDGVPELFTYGGGKMDYNKAFRYDGDDVTYIHWATDMTIYSNGIIRAFFQNSSGYDLYTYYRYDYESLEQLYRYADWGNNTYSQGDDAYEESSAKVSWSVIKKNIDELVGKASIVDLIYHDNTEQNREKYVLGYDPSISTKEYREYLNDSGYNYINIREIDGTCFEVEIFFLRLTGTEEGVKAYYTSPTTAYFSDEESRLSGTLTFSGDKLLLDLDEVEDYYFDDDLSEFVNGLHHEFELVKDETETDTDGDGLCDAWEKRGADLNGDGVVDLALNKMGADPEVPDIFIEVDWMVRPEEKFLWITTQSEFSYAPDSSSMKMVYEAFKRNGVNLHIDVGASSVDYVTGREWGSLSGGNQIDYTEAYEIGDSNSTWRKLVKANMSRYRNGIFHHCMFVNKYQIEGSATTSSGISDGIPGQNFLVANQDWVRDKGDFGVPGTFMHELGHNLGLYHGGFDEDDEPDPYTNYKPNHLSVMNYLYQTSGLYCWDNFEEWKLDYSQVSLPDLNENWLIEGNGIDPERATFGFPYGAMFLGTKTIKVSPSYGKALDFNNNGQIDSDPVEADINSDGTKTILKNTTPEWPRIKYCELSETAEESSTSGAVSDESLNEFSLDEALLHNNLADPGTGALEALGPFTLAAGTSDQNVYVRVKNMGSEDAEFTLDIQVGAVNDEMIEKVRIPGSVEKIEYKDVAIPVKEADTGSYNIRAVLKYEGMDDVETDIPLILYQPYKSEMEALRKKAASGISAKVAPEVASEIKKLSERKDIPLRKIKIGDTWEIPAGTVKVISVKSKTAALIRGANKKSVSVPSTAKIDGKSYKIVQINAKSFTGKKIRTVTVGSNVKKIAKYAFKSSGATKMIVKTKLLKKNTVKGSLKGSKVKIVQVKVGKKSVNKKFVSKYKKIFTKKNAGKKVTVK